jgi:hypothetical protein
MPNERLTQLVAEARTAFATKAMWWMRPDLDASTQWPLVVRALRTHGGHAGMLLAERIVEAAHAPHQPSA